MNQSHKSVQFIPMSCPNCGGDLMISKDQDKAICSYCGKPFMIQATHEGVQADNYIELADSALELNNLEEASDYYNKALEREPHNYIALYGKAKVHGLHSSMDNYLFGEAAVMFDKAIECAPEAEKQKLQDRAYIDLLTMAGSMAKLICKDCSEFKEKLSRLTKSQYDDYHSIIWNKFKTYYGALFGIGLTVKRASIKISNIDRPEVWNSIVQIRLAFSQLSEKVVLDYGFFRPSRYISWDLFWEGNRYPEIKKIALSQFQDCQTIFSKTMHWGSPQKS